MDTKYIDANKFKRVYESFNIKYKNSEAVVMIPVKSIIQSIENAEAADVAPVRHGRWIGCDTQCGIACSICGTPVDDFCHSIDYIDLAYKPNYCPNCGARMNEGDGGDGQI